jgi:predicted acyltransferase
MVLMIFVNDLWSLEEIPNWLKHVSATADGMGLADIVFPAFLFIVGLSVPYALQSRKKKGDTNMQIWLHIIYRTVALLVMGFLFVNSETYENNGALLDKNVWVLLLVIGFFLIWLDYPNPEQVVIKALKAIGIGLLIGLACIYRSKTGTGITALTPQWWGILGKIGWAYFTVSSIYLFSAQRFFIQVIAFALLLGFCVANQLGYFKPIIFIKDYIWIAGNGSVAALTMAGLIISMLYRKYGVANKQFWLMSLLFAIVVIAFGFLTRPVWGISKIRATPSWVAICIGISILGFLVVSFITDIRKKTTWYNIIKPAGTFTLTCYLIPYIHYALIKITGIMQLPVFLRTGVVGLIKSLIYALIIVFITGLLAKRHLRLKL